MDNISKTPDKALKTQFDSDLKRQQKNRFLIKFPEESEIKGWFVKKVEKSPINFLKKTEKTFTVTFNENNEWGDVFFKEQCEVFNNLDSRTIIFEYLDENGCVIYSEKFINCTAMQINFDVCDYSDNTLKTCSVIFKYLDCVDSKKILCIDE